jgi:hypothetical protein
MISVYSLVCSSKHVAKQKQQHRETITADIGSSESCITIEMAPTTRWQRSPRRHLVPTTRMGTGSGFLRFGSGGGDQRWTYFVTLAVLPADEGTRDDEGWALALTWNLKLGI